VRVLCLGKAAAPFYFFRNQGALSDEPPATNPENVVRTKCRAFSTFSPARWFRPLIRAHPACRDRKTRWDSLDCERPSPARLSQLSLSLVAWVSVQIAVRVISPIGVALALAIYLSIPWAMR